VQDFLTATAQRKAFASTWPVDVFPHEPFVYHREMDGVSAFVLAGGRSTRMGADKAFVKFGGCTLLARALQLAGSTCSEAWIVGPRQTFAAFGQVVEDVFPNHGPLAGIHAALRTSNTDLNFLLAVDLPFVEIEFVRYLLDHAQRGKAMVTVPRAAGGWQPLCAFYRKPFADVAEAALRQGANKIDLLFANLDVRTIEEDELKFAGFSPEIFRNLNTQEDLRVAPKAKVLSADT
jgi:molybdopterin-guanine dinucleotide biosynthesis protein A